MLGAADAVLKEAIEVYGNDILSFLAIVKSLIMGMFIVRVRCAIQTLFALQQNIDIRKGHGNV